MTKNRTLPESSRAKNLRVAMSDEHERLDASMQAVQAFADRERYGRFLKVQQAFHRDLDALYLDARIGQLIPGIAGSGRLPVIEQDMRDLGVKPVAVAENPEFGPHAKPDLPKALGWLYVAEGSRLGAALLLKWAGDLGLSESFGARHLAASPEGRGLHWKLFLEAFDAVALSSAEEARLIAGGRAAFGRVQQLVDRLFSTP